MKRLTKYLIITFSISWVLWLADAILVKYTDLRESDVGPMLLFMVGGFGPTIAAVCCLEGKRSCKNIGRFIFSCEKRSFLFLMLFVTLEIAIFLLSAFKRNTQMHTAMIPFAFLQTTFICGGNEELGWRGIMQPMMQKKFSYPTAAFIVGAVWALWHIPLWLIDGNSHQGSSFIMFALLAIILSYWLSAIINSKGSVFWCMILHGATNTLLSVFVIKINGVFILGLLLMTVIAVIIGMRRKTAHE